MSSIRRQLQITFVAGLLVIIPIAVPVWVFWELFTFVDRLLAPLVGGALGILKYEIASESIVETDRRQRTKQKRHGSKRAPPLSRVGLSEIGERSTRMRQRLTNAKPALAHWIGNGGSALAK